MTTVLGSDVRMDFRLTDEQELLRRTVREFAETEIRPHVREWDEAQHFPSELIPALAALGLMGIQFPEQYGGAGMSAIDYCICIEELARVDPGAGAVGRRAQRPVRGAHLHVRHRGAEAAVPGAARQRREDRRLGADRVDIRQRRRRHAHDRDAAPARGWVLNGSKTFITHGRVGHVMVVMAVTDKRGRHARASPPSSSSTARPGMRAGKKEDKLGMRASDTSEVLFENCGVPADQLLGEEGQGFVNTMQVLDAGRIGIAALSVGLAQGAYEAALATRRSGRRSARPSARSRRFSGSSPTTPRASRRRGC